MASCEKCWKDAFATSKFTGRHQDEVYRALVARRDREGQTCSPQERAGQFWDETSRRDNRIPVEDGA